MRRELGRVDEHGHAALVSGVDDCVERGSQPVTLEAPVTAGSCGGGSASSAAIAAETSNVPPASHST